MARTRVRRRRVALAILIGSMTWLVVGPVSHGLVAGAQGRHQAGMAYVVRPGDSLWTIAERQGPSGVDPRAVVDAIERANGVEPASLRPGQVLLVPTSA